MKRVFNFNAGPAMLPEEVLQKAQAELLDWHGTGMSIMELGHRGPEFKEVAETAENDLRDLMSIPANYHVLFNAGGASTQFAMVPLNLMGINKKADYLDTGIWSKKAIDEAKRVGEVNIIAKTEIIDNLITVPAMTTFKYDKNAAYVHYTPNETIEGVACYDIPQTGNIPLVADMTSLILSKPIDVSQYGIIYAGAQKNIGQAGITVIIIREDLIKDPLPFTPTLYSYKIMAENKSFYNTPPTFAWYIAGLVFKWMKSKGGVPYFANLNQQKAKKLYSFIDEHKDFYLNNINPHNRSIINIPFNLVESSLTESFLKLATENGLTNLKGHRLAGGVRASIYNAMPMEGVDKLIHFMRDFAKKFG